MAPTEELKIFTFSESGNGKKVTVGLEHKGVGELPRKNVEVRFLPLEIHVRIVTDQKSFVFSHRLSHAIVPNQSSYKVKPDKISLRLAKLDPHIKWNSLGKGNFKGKPAKMEEKEGSSGIERRKEDDVPNPDANIMDLLKKMYDEGDDELRRTINKAWAESHDKKMDGKQ